MSKVLCIGDICADIVIPYGLAKNEGIADVQFKGGGTVANCADGLGKLNANVSFLGTAGTDYYGKNLKKQLEDDNVDTKYLKLTDDYPTSQVLCIIDENNDRFNFLVPKENAAQNQILDTDLNDCLLDEYDYIHTSGMILFENPAASAISNFLEKAQKKGIKVSLDINLRIETFKLNPQYLLKAIENTNFLFGSLEDEIMPLTGKTNAEEAIKSLVNENRVVVARQGEKGATVYTNDASYHSDCFKVDVIDTIGAGDNYDAGFIYGLLNGKDLNTCNKYGCATAAINLTKKGARNCPTEKELLDFIAKNQ